MKSKRGGRRAGAGRPRKPPVFVPKPTEDIDWAQVERFAAVGGSEAEIVTALGITDAQLKDAETAQKLRAIVVRGEAMKGLLLQERIHGVGMGEAKGGSNTLALEARNRLGWDKQMATQEQPPDLTSVRARLTLTLERLAKVKSEEVGRAVDPLEILLSLIEAPKVAVH